MSIITLATASFVIEEFCALEFVHVILSKDSFSKEKYNCHFLRHNTDTGVQIRIPNVLELDCGAYQTCYLLAI